MKKRIAFHPRNKHQGHYDFAALIRALPVLGDYVQANKYGDDSIDFADAQAVLTLNRALLKHYYGIAHWNIPENSLCPPIPGRSDYIHQLADLVGTESSNRILDIGVGANCIYPTIGHHEYGWSFVGSDIDPRALESGRKMIQQNPSFGNSVDLRLQKSTHYIFDGVVQAGETFAASMCNPPFHSSLEEAQAGTRRKWGNLGRDGDSVHKNFGGQGAELWCEGGELAFIKKMIKESTRYKNQFRWFTTLVSQNDHLIQINYDLNQAKVQDFRVLDMAQGQKKSRIIAWKF